MSHLQKQGWATCSDLRSHAEALVTNPVTRVTAVLPLRGRSVPLVLKATDWAGDECVTRQWKSDYLRLCKLLVTLVYDEER